MKKVAKGSPSSKSKNDNTFHLAIAPVLCVAQICGLLPISGIFSRNYRDIRFKVLSFRTIHSLMWLGGGILFLYMEIKRLSSQKINEKSLGGIAFYCTGLVSAAVYFRIATKWDGLLELFKDIEDILNNHPYQLTGWSLRKRINVLSLTVLGFGVAEHLMSWYSFIHDRLVQVEKCHWDIGSWPYYIVTTHLSQIYDVLPTNTFTVIWSEYMNIAFTFAWTFADVFIMVMSISIAIKFRTINDRLEMFKERIVSNLSWDEIRYHYNKVCDLNEYVDEMLGTLICVASLSDLYSVCFQILNIATPIPFLVNKIYTWYSTLFLIFRTAAMFLITASVNDESLKPIAIFRTIPSSGWHQELQRLSYQIQQNRVALSGRSFFFLTRGILISIAGTIVTYEMVLLQFGGNKILPGMFNPCGDQPNNTAPFE